MTFDEMINAYLEQTGASQSDLAETSGFSAATISRYLAGERTPDYDSPVIARLAAGICRLGEKKGVRLNEADLDQALRQTLPDGLKVEYPVFLSNLRQVLNALDIRGSELARALNYDASHISKILSGQRRPGNLHLFVNKTSAYIAGRVYSHPEEEIIARLLGETENHFSNAAEARDRLALWLGSNASPPREEPVSRFLGQLENFDLNEYMLRIRFDELKVPPALPHLPVRTNYYGLKRMMDSELDFIKATVLSRSQEDCILYSDMPLTDMAADPDFPKKWMFGMAMMVKKGLHLHIIHDVNRPFPEMMLGLESNIPMYMTGQISPYYLPASQSMVFSHLLKVSGTAALEGSAIAGKQADGKYTLYRSKEDVAYYRKKAEALLKKASPLMDIYREERKEAYHATLFDLWKKGSRQILCSRLPLFTLSAEALSSVLERSSLAPERIREVTAFHERLTAAARSLLEKESLRLIVPRLTREQFLASPVHLALSDLFIEEEIPYSYEEYLAHFSETEQFAARYPGLVLEQTVSKLFHNIRITVFEENTVIVSKEKSPAIHFVIHHPKMVQAFREFLTLAS